MYALITPTFDGHLFFIEKYLRSLDVYLLDKEINIYFTTEEKNVDQLYDITSKYSNFNITIFSFDTLLKKNGIDLTSIELLNDYGKFSYQTLKKLLTVAHIPEQYSIVIDSESMMIRPGRVSDIIETFIANPFLAYSRLSERKVTSPFLTGVVENTARLLDTEPNEYFLEHFVWVYDKSILNDMFHSFDGIFSLVKKAKLNCGENLFEIQTYLAFIFLNNEKYGYDIINVLDAVKNIDEGYLDKYYKTFKGNFGVLEMAGAIVTRDNYQRIAELFDKLHITMMRSEYHGRMKYHNKLIELIQPVFLCSSQEHSFGINATIKNRLLDATDTRWEVHIINHHLDVLKIKHIVSLAYRLCRVIVKIPVNFILNKFR
ncbi:hypothetical protein ABC356_003850 [Salmonella enterica]|nr:hypothetical protein [Salmonella enterica]ECK6279925.1 hypothetical protein [Salmonella enterica]EDQ7909803.1 hypothetical protein [Salmonella enterica]EFV1988888.1 hypothetical protein [Salmonella enterica]EGA3815883.1 hypothetical protein [Salmonella enterica]